MTIGQNHHFAADFCGFEGVFSKSEIGDFKPISQGWRQAMTSSVFNPSHPHASFLEPAWTADFDHWSKWRFFGRFLRVCALFFKVPKLAERTAGKASA